MESHHPIPSHPTLKRRHHIPARSVDGGEKRSQDGVMVVFGLSRKAALKLFGLSFLVGAGMELFMISTGFYRIVTRYSWPKCLYILVCLLPVTMMLLTTYRKEGERRLEAELQSQERIDRLKRLNIDLDQAESRPNSK